MEQRLISGNDLLKHFSVSNNGTRYRIKDCDNFPTTVNLEYVQKQIRTAPTIDPLHALGACYCVECIKWDSDPDTYGDSDGIKGMCSKSFERVREDDFCSYGERKQNETH